LRAMGRPRTMRASAARPSIYRHVAGEKQGVYALRFAGRRSDRRCDYPPMTILVGRISGITPSAAAGFSFPYVPLSLSLCVLFKRRGIASFCENVLGKVRSALGGDRHDQPA
jgi:hypothetical protein